MLKQHFTPMYPKKVYFGFLKELDERKLKYLIKLLVHAGLSQKIFNEVKQVLKLDDTAEKKYDMEVEEMISYLIKKEKEKIQTYKPIKFIFEDKIVIEKSYGWDYDSAPKNKIQPVYPVIAQNIDKIMKEKKRERLFKEEEK